jgi:hypothetical protein
MAEGCVADWSAIYLKESLNSSIAIASMGFAGFSVLMAVGRFNGDVWVLSTGPKRLVVAGTILATIGFSLVVFFSYPATAISGQVTAKAVNNCGTSATRTTNVNLAACPPPGFAGGNNGNNGSVQTKGGQVPGTAKAAPMEVKIFPNPTVSDFKLQVITSQKEEINVRVIDNEGRLYRTFKVMPYQTIALGAELKPGSYMVEVRQGKVVKTNKVIKF